MLGDWASENGNRILVSAGLHPSIPRFCPIFIIKSEERVARPRFHLKTLFYLTSLALFGRKADSVGLFGFTNRRNLGT